MPFSNVKFGIAPIGWTNDDLPELGGHIPFEQCISEMSQAGYEGCEVGNKYPRDTKELAEKLAPHNLQIASAWFSTFFTDDSQDQDQNWKDYEAHLTFLKEMGADRVNICECGHSIQCTPKAVLEEKPVFTDEQWEKLFAGLNKAGKRAQELGLKLAYHYHMGTGVQNKQEIDRLMEGTDPNLVFILADTGHSYFAGDDPLEVIRQYRDRIAHVHLKDIRQSVLEQTKAEKWSFLKAVKEGVFTVPGDGAIDFKPVFGLLEGYNGWMIVEAEQDPSKAPPLEYATKSRAYIRELTNQ